MKPEELLCYDRMYAAMRQALGTPWLVLGFPGVDDRRHGRPGSGRAGARRGGDSEDEPVLQECLQAPRRPVWD